MNTTHHPAARIRELNDSFRKTFAGGNMVMTANVAALPEMVKLSAGNHACKWQWNDDQRLLALNRFVDAEPTATASRFGQQEVQPTPTAPYLTAAT
jgi:hypothetical protein